MKVGEAVAEIMKREGIEILCGYPVNHLLEYAAAADIRPIIVRQERIGLHMADAISRVTSGRKIGAFCMQHGPGSENAYGGVAQAYGESVPLLVIPQGYPRRIADIDPNFSAVTRDARRVARSPSTLIVPAELPNVMRRAFNNLRNGRSGPAIVEIPTDIWNEEIGDLDYTPVARARYAPDPADVRKAAAAILAAQAAGDLCRHRRAMGRGVAAASRIRRTAGRAGHHQPRRQELVPGKPSAVAGLRRQRGAEAGASFRRTMPT